VRSVRDKRALAKGMRTPSEAIFCQECGNVFVMTRRGEQCFGCGRPRSNGGKDVRP
jgi:hypothetical protein